jgi:hypothetical protein
MLVARVRFSEARLGARLRWLCCSLVLVLLAPPRAAGAEPAGAFDVKIMAELEAESPEAAGVFRRANEARDHNDLEGAATLYREVRRLAPSFFHATRRLCGIERELGHREAAIALCREALAAAETPQNLSTLGAVLVSGEPSSAELDEAGHDVRRAMGLAPDDMAVHAMACEVALHRKDVALLKLCSTRLDQIAPTNEGTLFFGSIVALNEERFGDARDALDRARDGGLPPRATRASRR